MDSRKMVRVNPLQSSSSRDTDIENKPMDMTGGAGS